MDVKKQRIVPVESGRSAAVKPSSAPQARRVRRRSTVVAVRFAFLFGFLCAAAFSVSSCEARPLKVRPPVVAGQFYPADPAKLEAAVKGFLDQAKPRPGDRAEALLVPHAGYVFSGQVAADGFAQAPPDFRRVFILTANHNPRARFHGVSLDDSDIYRVPGADIPVARLTRELIDDPLFLVNQAGDAHGYT